MKRTFSLSLIFIKSLHTLIWLLLAATVVYVLWSGITGQIDGYTWLAVTVISGEGLVLLLFHGSCPLTPLAARYSDSAKANFDIYLPEWLAKYNKLIFGTIFIIGLVLILLRYILS